MGNCQTRMNSDSVSFLFFALHPSEADSKMFKTLQESVSSADRVLISRGVSKVDTPGWTFETLKG